MGPQNGPSRSCAVPALHHLSPFFFRCGTPIFGLVLGLFWTLSSRFPRKIPQIYMFLFGSVMFVPAAPLVAVQVPPEYMPLEFVEVVG